MKIDGSVPWLPGPVTGLAGCTPGNLARRGAGQVNRFRHYRAGELAASGSVPAATSCWTPARSPTVATTAATAISRP